MAINKVLSNNKKPFLEHIHIFRAFAIFNVMMVHLWSSGDFEGQLSFANLCRAIFFGNSTVYFIFISGFLFEYLAKNFQIKRYYFKKIYFVISPYLVVSLFLTIVASTKGHFFDNNIFTFKSFFNQYFTNIITGHAAFQLWYIPFITIVFLLSPLLLKIPKKSEKILFFSSALLPLLGTRTDTDITLMQFLYFLPVYILGFYTSKNYSLIIAYIEKHKRVFLYLSIITTILLFVIYDNEIKYSVFSLKESVFYIQKICFTFYLIVQLKKVKLNRFYNILANYSFALYFLHTFFSTYTQWGVLNFINLHINFLAFPLSILIALGYIILTIIVIWLLKRILKNKSRYFIGA